MKLAFALYKYFPFGGLQRDFLRIAEACHERDCQIRVYTLDWRGERPSWIEFCPVPVKGMTSQSRNRRFTRWMLEHRQRHPVDALIGFNKMPGLDIYYAADGCYLSRSHDLHGRLYGLYRLGRRHRHFSGYERAVFGPGSKTEILMISERQRPIFESCYGTQPGRFHMLPPGVERERMMPGDPERLRGAFRDEFGIAERDKLLLMVGSGFRTKGADRSVEAVAALPSELYERPRLFIVGQDNPSRIMRQAGRLGIADRLCVFSGRDDIARFMLGADVLIHPARHENTGTVLLEAIMTGLPVLTTAVCGYAHYVAESETGIVLPEPFEQKRLDRALAGMLGADEDQRIRWRENAKMFLQQVDIHGMPEEASRAIVSLAGGIAR